MKRAFLILLVVIVLIGSYIGYNYYQKIYAPAVLGTESKLLYISSDINYSSLLASLKDTSWLKSADDFDWVAQQKNYPNLLKSGKYKIEAGWSNAQLIDRLRSGEQIPVQVTFNNQRTIAQLAGRVSSYLEADSLEFLAYFTNQKTIRKYGFNSATFPALFIPNTYE
ncbi:MAG: endolytic transglycosylase MltG, partial [Bacteroidetes bacterium]|nr:endolytic transglycosylase MltG [Bacteroidota bacterium]